MYIKISASRYSGRNGTPQPYDRIIPNPWYPKFGPIDTLPETKRTLKINGWFEWVSLKGSNSRHFQAANLLLVLANIKIYQCQIQASFGDEIPLYPFFFKKNKGILRIGFKSTTKGSSKSFVEHLEWIMFTDLKISKNRVSAIDL